MLQHCYNLIKPSIFPTILSEVFFVLLHSVDVATGKKCAFSTVFRAVDILVYQDFAKLKREREHSENAMKNDNP